MDTIDLATIFKRFRLLISGTLSLLFIENIVIVLYPYLVGLTITDLLDGQYRMLTIIGATFGFHLFVGVLRRVYDTRVYSKIYAVVASELVDAQRSGGDSDSEIVARVEMLRELVDFFEHDLPNGLMSVSSLFGAVIMLGILDWRISLLCLGAMIFLGVVYGLSQRTIASANRSLNDAYEHQMNIICKAGRPRVRAYFHILRGRAVWLSDLDAGLSAALEMVLIGVFVSALLLATTGGNPTPGPIVAIMTYVFEFYGSMMFFPYLLQQKTRLSDISGRLGSEKRDALT